MRRTFTVVDIVEILNFWYAGRSQHEIARALGVDCQRSRRSPHWRPRVLPADGHGKSPRTATGCPRGRPRFLPADGHVAPRLVGQGHHPFAGEGVGET